VAALKAYEIEGAEAFHSHPLTAGYAELLLNNGIYVDFMADLQSFKQIDFKECYQIAEIYTTDKGIKIPVLHINKLIDEKQKSTRPKDQADAEHLIKLYRKN
jgi:hypothetical protein